MVIPEERALLGVSGERQRWSDHAAPHMVTPGSIQRILAIPDLWPRAGFLCPLCLFLTASPGSGFLPLASLSTPCLWGRGSYLWLPCHWSFCLVGGNWWGTLCNFRRSCQVCFSLKGSV